MAPKKRAPGGGRKPKGEFKGKLASFSTRITPELREELDRAAQQSGSSLSQEVERRLRYSIKQNDVDKLEGPHHRALARAVSQLVQRIELQTGERWLGNAFTFQALKAGIDAWLNGVANLLEGPLAEPANVPPRMEEHLARLERRGPELAKYAEQMRHPDGVGISIGLGLLNQIETANMSLRLDDGPPPNYLSSDYGRLAIIREELGIAPRKFSWRVGNPWKKDK
jgi:hypothetical protein